ncbi:MAG: hypothetical protein LBR27_02210 [Bifidobacteriaceae bacterium]|jgi:hypothetical protein|nr:hypothetical protein [Bifidobacteriaceae bacterium]
MSPTPSPTPTPAPAGPSWPVNPDWILPPVRYSTWWLWLAAFLAIAAVLVVLLPWLVRRIRLARARRPVTVPVPRPPSTGDVAVWALQRIDQIERQHAEGKLNTRSALQQISQVVREFASSRFGLPAHSLTLAGLKKVSAVPIGRVTALIEALYPGEFAADGEGEVAAAAHRARQVVWS